MNISRLLLVLVFSLAAVTVNAQIFVGGSVSLSSNVIKTDDTGIITDRSVFSLALSPKAGFFVSEKMAIGSELYLGRSVDKLTQTSESSSTISSFGISPFMRYYPVSWKRFSMFGQVNCGVQFASLKNKSAGTLIDDINRTNFYTSLYPGLAFDVNERFSLETTLSFLGFSYSFTKMEDGTEVTKTSGFNMGANLNSITTTGGINIGAIIRF